MNLIVVAQAPGKDGPSAAGPLSGDAGRRLARACGFPHGDLMAVERVNLLGHFAGKAGKGDRFDAKAARIAAAALRPLLAGRDVVVCGVAVAHALGVKAAPLTWVRCGGFRAMVVPHPSGVNLWWNDPDNRRRAALALRPLFARRR